MNKKTGKVVSLALAMAMVVSSFSATLVSATTTEVSGNKARVDTNTSSKDEYYLVSDKYKDVVILDDLDNKFDVTSMDRETLDDVEYVSFSKKSGDALVKVAKDSSDSDKKNLYLKKGASGKEVISITYKGTYTDDNTDKEVTVRGSIDVTIVAYAQGEAMIGMYDGATINNLKAFRPLETAAVNDSDVRIALYMADFDDNGNGVLETITPYAEYGDKSGSDRIVSSTGKNTAGSNIYFDFGSQKVFAVKDSDVVPANHVNGGASATVDPITHEIILPLIRTSREGDSSSDHWTAKVATTDITLYAPKITVKVENGKSVTDVAQPKDKTVDGKTIKVFESSARGDKFKEKIGVGKAWRVGGDIYGDLNTVSKIGARTVIGSSSYNKDDKYSDAQNNVFVISNYDVILMDTKVVNMTNASVKSVKAWSTTIEPVATTNRGEGTSVSAETSSIGDVTVRGDVTLSGGSAGVIKKVTGKIGLDDGAKIDSIDAGDSVLNMSGATISGSAKVTNATISDDSDYSTSVGGDLKSKVIDITADDGKVKIGGSLIVREANQDFNLSGANLTVGAIDADYYDTSISMDEFSGKISVKNSYDTGFELTNNSNVTVTNATSISSVDVEDGSKFGISDSTTITDISGDGTFTAPADKLYVAGSMDGVKFQLTTNPAVGTIALRSSTDSVAFDDFRAVGFTADVTAVNKSVDKMVIKAVKFAGLGFDKSSVEIAKGFSDSVTVQAYPNGTQLPQGAKVAWNLEGDDDYISYTVEGNTATVKVTNYNTDYAYSNSAILTATLVDSEGYELDPENYVAASCDIKALAVPNTTVTVDTKTLSKNVGEIYQFIAKSSDASALTAETSDASVATVALYDAKDARGYKFQINAVGAGSATITVKNGFGATATIPVTVVAGVATLKLDTTSYKMAPGNIYDFKVSTTGTSAKPVVTDSRNGSVVKMTDLGNGKYRITGVKAGTTYIQATINNTRVSMTVVVENGAKQGGVAGNNISTIK